MAEFERAKVNLITSMERSFKEKDKTESSNYVEEYIRNFLTNEPIPGIEIEYQYHKDLLPAISLQDVNAIATNLNANTNYVTYITGPDANTNTLPTGDALIAAVDATAKRKDIKAYEEKAVATTLLKRTLKAGKIVSSIKTIMVLQIKVMPLMQLKLLVAWALESFHQQIYVRH